MNESNRKFKRFDKYEKTIKDFFVDNYKEEI